MAGREGAFDVRSFLRAKRDGARHDAGAVHAFIAAYTAGDVPDYQVAAWLMAVFFRGLDDEEAFALTDAMLHSGDVLTLKDLPGPTVDKHSTGGVGDKISLPLAPIVAACGACVPMISGRGLGHTGGTLDKLEAIPGFSPKLAPARFASLVKAHGLAFGGQTDRLAPADGKLYALRDVTATVECIPLIVASILSKKYASGTDRVVFDVKTGRGAFMRERAQAVALARSLIAVSARMGKSASALVTNMDQPLGRAVGNGLEVVESLAILRGEGPPDVRDLTLALAAEMLVLAGLEADLAVARGCAARAVESGAAFGKFREIIEAQGGDPRVVDEPVRLPRARHIAPALATRAGYVTAIDAYAVGELIVRMGGGRAQKDDKIDHRVGLVLERKVGDRVEAGEPLAEVHAERDEAEVARALVAAYTIGDAAGAATPLVLERLGAGT
jgi:pyrimidine-nucleoside phosphorylase